MLNTKKVKKLKKRERNQKHWCDRKNLGEAGTVL